MGWIDEPSVLPGKSEQVESLHCLYEVLFWKIFFFFVFGKVILLLWYTFTSF